MFKSVRDKSIRYVFLLLSTVGIEDSWCLIRGSICIIDKIPCFRAAVRQSVVRM